MDIQTIKQFLIERGCRLKGCNRFNIKRIEWYFRVSLPAVYKDFLYAMGKGAGQYMLGDDAFFGSIFSLREDFEGIVVEKNLFLPETAFVFWSHQGYQYAYFRTDDGDDPTVYFYDDGDTINKEGSLTDFYTEQLIMSGFKIS